MSSELLPFGSLNNSVLTRAEQRDRAVVVRQTRQSLDRVNAAAVVAMATERTRASLTEEALLNAGALSALEGHLIGIAPLGEARYKAIVDGYAIGAAQAIGRWGR